MQTVRANTEGFEDKRTVDQTDYNESYLTKANRVVASSAAFIALSSLATIPGIREESALEHPKNITFVSNTYRAENKLDEKLKKTFEQIYHLVFEYKARVSSIDNKNGMAILEADIGDDVEYLEWPIDQIPFPVTAYSSFKMQGYKVHGQERFRFIQTKTHKIDPKTLEMIEQLDHV